MEGGCTGLHHTGHGPELSRAHQTCCCRVAVTPVRNRGWAGIPCLCSETSPKQDHQALSASTAHGNPGELWWRGQPGLSRWAEGCSPPLHASTVWQPHTPKLLAACTVLWHAVPEAWREGDWQFTRYDGAWPAVRELKGSTCAKAKVKLMSATGSCWAGLAMSYL